MDAQSLSLSRTLSTVLAMVMAMVLSTAARSRAAMRPQGSATKLSADQPTLFVGGL